MSGVTSKAIDAVALAIRECGPSDIEDLVKEIPGLLTAFSDEMKRVVAENKKLKVELTAVEAQVSDLRTKVIEEPEEPDNIIRLAG